MREMTKQLLRSVLSLVALLALGAGATYALFTSGPVTISSNALTTGEAAIKICDSTPGGIDSWDTTINPTFTLSGLIPGEPSSTLTENTVYVGNDNGSLNNNLAECTGYTAATSDSDVDMQLVPQITGLTCPVGAPELADELEVEILIGGSSTGFFTLNEWAANTAAFLPTLSPDVTASIVMNAQLDAAATAQNQTCTFDMTFTGEQV